MSAANNWHDYQASRRRAAKREAVTDQQQEPAMIPTSADNRRAPALTARIPEPDAFDHAGVTLRTQGGRVIGASMGTSGTRPPVPGGDRWTQPAPISDDGFLTAREYRIAMARMRAGRGLAEDFYRLRHTDPKTLQALALNSY